MILLDVNVLVHAYREEAPDHALYARWLHRAVEADEPCGVTGVVLSGMVRIVTNPRVFRTPAPTSGALEFAEALLDRPTVLRVEPGTRHWAIFTRLCKEAGAKGDLVPDAWLAAVAVESGSELITADRGFARFPGLRWRHPLAAQPG